MCSETNRPSSAPPKMQNKIAALDGTPARGNLDQLVGPCLDRAAPLEPHFDNHAAKSNIGLRNSFIVVELRDKALGIPQRIDFTDDPCPCVSIEHRPGVPTKIVQRAWRASHADESCLGLELEREGTRKFGPQGSVDEEMLWHGASPAVAPGHHRRASRWDCGRPPTQVHPDRRRSRRSRTRKSC